MKKLFCLVLTLCLLMTSCAAFAETVDYKADYAAKISKLADSMRAYYEASGETEKIAPYAEPLSIHMVSRYNSGMQDAMSIFTNKYGESWDVNRYTELYKNTYFRGLDPDTIDPARCRIIGGNFNSYIGVPTSIRFPSGS